MATTLRADLETRTTALGTTRTLGDLVVRAAAFAPDAIAVSRPDHAVSFAQLVAAARAAMISMSSSATIDDSTLTVALMMTVPGLAASGPSGLAVTLASLRTAATVAAGTPDRTR